MDDKTMKNIDIKPMADVANNLINKVTEAVGWLATPKGKRANRIEAENFLIKKIKSNPDMPELTKAALICNVRKIINEYVNQNDIVQEAIHYLDDSATPKNIDNEWLSFFMDKCKNISSEDIKTIWAQILASECNKNGTITKRFLNVLSMMDKEDANSFNKLIQFQVRAGEDYTKGEPIIFIYGHVLHSYYEEYGLTYKDISALESAGLIKSDELHGVYYPNSSEKECIFSYFDVLIRLYSEENEIPIGHMSLTREGVILAQILEISKIDSFPEHIKEYYENCNMYEKQNIKVDISRRKSFKTV